MYEHVFIQVFIYNLNILFMQHHKKEEEEKKNHNAALVLGFSIAVSESASLFYQIMHYLQQRWVT